MPWLYLSENELRHVAQAHPELGVRLWASVAEDNTEAANACRGQARDDDEFTPEWDGAVSFCDDGKAWVMTWELVDNPNAESEEA